MRTEAQSFLQAEGLCKRYVGRTVVRDLNLQCHPGEVVGLLGPNGAGKTTTLRMLYGLVRPDAGRIRYGGLDFATHRTEAKRQLGVCTQDDTLDHDLTVRQNLHTYAAYFRPRVGAVHERVAELSARFGLGDCLDASPRTLSGGYRQRVLVARSLVHNPRVLFLDEPTTGLDPDARINLWHLIRALRDEGMAIVLTTHYMDEAERLSDRLVVLLQGKVVAEGSAAMVMGSLVGEHVVVLAASHPQAAAICAWYAEHQARMPRRVLDEWQLPMPGDLLAEALQRFPEPALTVRPPKLDDLFLRLSEGQDAQ